MLLAAAYGTPLDRGTEALPAFAPLRNTFPVEKPSGAIGIFDTTRPAASRSRCIATPGA
jgi:hypothetical protein